MVEQTNLPAASRLSVAPMMDWTDQAEYEMFYRWLGIFRILSCKIS